MKMSYILSGSYFAGLDRSINSPKSNQDRWKNNSDYETLAYTQLLNCKMFDDALLIQLLYSLSLDPEKLSMLIQSNFNKDEFLCYQNYKTGEKSKIFLDDCLIWFMLISSTLKESLVLTSIFTKENQEMER